MIRLDKLLAGAGFGSRKDVKALIKNVTVDGEAGLRPETKVNPETAEIYVNDTLVEYKKFTYIIMNKPTGVISATRDRHEKTVIDLLDDKHRKMRLFPVGRLDKDTTGLLILTNDGDFAHRALSPNKHVEKVYHATVSRSVTPQDVQAFAKGIKLADGYCCRSAGLRDLGGQVAEVVIFEGKFHQVKRMFLAVGIQVLALKRVAFGGIKLDDSLELGQWRVLQNFDF